MLVNIWKYLEDLNELSFKEHPQGICRASKGVADLKMLGTTEVDIALEDYFFCWFEKKREKERRNDVRSINSVGRERVTHVGHLFCHSRGS